MNLRRPTLSSGTTRTATAALCLLYLLLVVLASNGNWTEVGRLVISGLQVGAIAALAGVGLVLTYQATGVLNLAQGGVATVAGFVFYELVSKNGLNVAWAGIIAVGITGPVMGLGFEALVFRRLDRRGASTSERLVANLGALVFLLAICVLAFGETSRNAPPLFPTSQAFSIGPVGVGWSVVGTVGLLIAGAGGLSLLLQRTPLGRRLRAVVDRRGLAEMAGIDAGHTSAIAWALGCTFAALVGVLYAPQIGLEAGYFTLTVLGTLSVAVVARLRSIPVAVLTGLGLGIAGSLWGVLARPHYPSWLPLPHVPYDIGTELFVIATLVFLLGAKSDGGFGEQITAARSRLVTGSFSRAHHGREAVVRSIPAVAAVLITLVAPALLSPDDLATAQLVVAYAVTFLSITAITGMAGRITLATASFGGLGAYATARLSNGYLPLPTGHRIPHLPVLLAMVVSVALATGIGLLLGLPALRRRGLVLALLTLAFAQGVDALVFQEPSWISGGLTVRRPNLFGLSLASNPAFAWFELAMLAIVVLLVRNLRSGALGRSLGAMRDSPVGAQASGLSLRRSGLLVFGFGAAVAALGGTLISQASLAVDLGTGGTFSPLSGLYWFAAVVVCGLSFRLGAVLAAVIFVVVDHVVGQEGAGLAVIGFLAMLQGSLPGGLVGVALRLYRGEHRPGRTRRLGPVGRSLVAYVEADRERHAVPAPGTGRQPSPLAETVLAEVAAANS